MSIYAGFLHPSGRSVFSTGSVLLWLRFVISTGPVLPPTAMKKIPDGSYTNSRYWYIISGDTWLCAYESDAASAASVNIPAY